MTHPDKNGANILQNFQSEKKKGEVSVVGEGKGRREEEMEGGRDRGRKGWREEGMEGGKEGGRKG